MKIKQNRRRAINLLLGALGAVLVLGAAASSINLMATQTAAQAESMPAQSESVTLRPATQAATGVTGDYRGNVTLNHAVAGVFSDSLATPVPDQSETLAAPVSWRDQLGVQPHAGGRQRHGLYAAGWDLYVSRNAERGAYPRGRSRRRGPAVPPARSSARRFSLRPSNLPPRLRGRRSPASFA